jgi:hypothetical protein
MVIGVYSQGLQSALSVLGLSWNDAAATAGAT